ncbi:MAG: class I SAM-dependent methyltransferase [Candidatus Marinimicrobia bacterium]|jgi:ubiquinone/menaquinone biosynthesis C-methylase UbiE|nr:class I SAM-dependent methyltransferase [Candidatus Neomarinimicrobiota bacterium]MBT4361081.1 class I SAM-dependent methyltransferase [Candidatus Neomarinimicrobiota bacterium]MBT4713503.1 class I SAM-dependent methyltransferase [Candidatus Neomarinimicrobiota bacterium]MBT4946685.1 class I SAM-dependent methyltransferase [Candidatus Neomarinimicrobiota bacterium]MBT5268680.1 class I SAM-dependent methyltransferase [Candidatus Neomarinimicrobiota bacterium]
MSDFKKYTQANREAWNEAMPHHQKSNADKWDNAFATQGFSVITEPELSLIKALNIEGQKIAHVCCNNGIELMSLKNMGAGECVGFDISDEAIQEAQGRAAKFDIACKFVQTDIYDIPEKYHDEFDIVYISIGCLGWMPGIQRFFGKIASLLNESGELFIHESHPFSEMLPSDDLENVDPMKIIEPYFKKDPYIDNDGIDYIGNTSYQSKTMYWFVWTISDIIMGIIDNGLKVRHFSEYPDDISTLHGKNQDAGPDIPLSYILIAEKE